MFWKELGTVAHICNSWGGYGRRILSLRPAWATQQDPVSKTNNKNPNVLEKCSCPSF
jgi:hypothetical protein